MKFMGLQDLNAVNEPTYESAASARDDTFASSSELPNLEFGLVADDSDVAPAEPGEI